MIRMLLSARWLGFAAFVLLIAGASIRLGLWQWHKWEARLDRNEIVAAMLKQDPVPLDKGGETGEWSEDAEWTRVTVRGTFDTKHELSVKFAVRDSQPGVEIVTPLVLADGTAVLVNRGWIPSDNTGTRPVLPPPPKGTVQVTGFWHPDNGAGPEATRPQNGQIRAIDSQELQHFVGTDLRDGFVGLEKQQPAASGELVTEEGPELGQGPHFFYALQWWFFAGLAIVGYIWFARAERKESAQP